VTARRSLSVVAGISLVYDLGTGLVLLVATERLAVWFGAQIPQPLLFAKLDALFLIAIGVGYVQPLRDPAAHRAYLWVFGPLLKGGGAVTFLIDHYVSGSPTSFLVFAASDAVLAVVTLVALLRPDDRPTDRASAQTASTAGIRPR
jgi:hypothetical protein